MLRMGLCRNDDMLLFRSLQFWKWKKLLHSVTAVLFPTRHSAVVYLF